MQRGQRAELLGHHQRRVVGQHHAARADADVSVAAAIAPIRTAGAELAMPGMLWCSASQYRVKPSSSARRASVDAGAYGRGRVAALTDRDEIEHGHRDLGEAHPGATTRGTAGVPARRGVRPSRRCG